MVAQEIVFQNLNAITISKRNQKQHILHCFSGSPYLMSVVKCNPNLITPFEIILQIFDLGYFLHLVFKQKKKIIKEKQSFNAISINRTEIHYKRAATDQSILK